MKRIANRYDRIDSYRRRKQMVEGGRQIALWNWGVQLYGSDLRQGMNTRIGPSRALRQYDFAGQMPNALGERALHRRQPRLNLPTVKI